MPLYALDDLAPTLADDAWVAPSADVIGDARLAGGASIWFGAVIRADNTPIRIGRNSNVQEGAMLHSDPGSPLIVGDDVTVGHHAILHGCTIGNGVLVGMGATVLNGAVIGEECLIGAGALVTENKVFEPGMMILGSPARAVKPLTPQQRAGLRMSAHHYVERARRFRETMRQVS